MSDTSVAVVQGITMHNFAMTIILAGGVMGLLGQGVRSTVGLKKLRDQTGESAALFAGNFSAGRFLVSLFIGFVAGALSAFFLSDENLYLKLNKELLIGFMAAGYAGADIVEGFAAKILPGRKSA